MSRHPRTGGLSQQNAIVTGAGRGIGRAIAMRLASAGAAVALVGRTDADLIETADAIRSQGGRALVLPADVTDRQAVAALVQQVRDELGPPHILVNAAGALRAIGPIWETDPDAWWDDVQVNLRSSALCAWAVLPDFVAQRHGTLINLVSLAVTMRSGYDSAYTSAKAAVVRLTTSLAVETEAHGVRVFAVDPGTVRTNLTQTLMDSPLGRRYFPFLQHMQPEHWTRPERPADLCVDLAAGRGGYLSGHVIHVGDTPSRLGWRLVGRLGMAWRELVAMRLGSGQTTNGYATGRPAVSQPLREH
jgi:NAD(P)-dependent dehydrogenase (short-subunit alcohol dehydrogenase family)